MMANYKTTVFLNFYFIIVIVDLQTLGSLQYSNGLRNLTILGLFPLTGGWGGGESALTAAEMALDHINARTDILPNYNLIMEWRNTKCNPGLGINEMYRLLYDPPTKIAILGDGCSSVSEATAQASFLWNITQISYLSNSPLLSNKKLYPYFFRLSVPEESINPARIAFIKKMGWKKIATIHQSYKIFSSLVDDLAVRMDKENIHMLTMEVFNEDPARKIENLKKHDARIIFASFYEETIFNVFCEIYKQGLYGPKYVWFILGWFDDRWWEKAYDTSGCTKLQLLKAINGHFRVGETFILRSKATDAARISGFEFLESFRIRNANRSDHGQKTAAQAYDSVWALALALDMAEKRLVQRGDSLGSFTYDNYLTGRTIYESFRNLSFGGLKGKIRFDESGDLVTLLKVDQMIDGVMHMTAVYYPDRDKMMIIEKPYFGHKGRYFPRDSTLLILSPEFISMDLYISLSVLASAGIVLVICCLIFNIRYREARIVKLSSPNINTLILFGCILIYSSVFFQETEPGLNLVFCHMRYIVIAIGFSLAFGALFAKTWRVHIIFRRIKPGQTVADKTLFAQITVLVLINVIVLITWFNIDPLQVVTYNTSQALNEAEDILLQYQVDVCVSDYHQYFSAALYIIHGVMLLIGTFLAWETRKVQIEDLNDSRSIGQCIYNTFVFSIISMVFSFVLENQVQVLYALHSGFVLFGTTMNIILLFVPKIIRYKKAQLELDGSSDRMNCSYTHRRASQPHIHVHTLESKIGRLETLLKAHEETIKDLREELKNQENRAISDIHLDTLSSEIPDKDSRSFS
ncbi:gamma-aminobutyric acid type B receptor subunit 1-like [Haliotis asinina]|uniref:gamma-aminobutyric acid type B receptor subunit 1-like n=1 Tax=Haliotis asinina TaxID=109174 RepID=UPI003531C592